MINTHVVCYDIAAGFMGGVMQGRNCYMSIGKDTCIAHYLAELVTEEKKKGRKPRPDSLHPNMYTKDKAYSFTPCVYMYMYMTL